MNEEINALLLDTHSAIEESARHVIEEIKARKFNITYPPDVKLTSEEQNALSKLRTDLNALNALQKVLISGASNPIFHLFELMDGVADPQYYDGLWLGVKFRLRSENDSSDFFLHDEFYATYEEWKKRATE